VSIDLRLMSKADLSELERSCFGELRPSQVPADWKAILQAKQNHMSESARVCFICGAEGKCRHREREMGIRWG
jgi:hypothetical protein